MDPRIGKLLQVEKHLWCCTCSWSTWKPLMKALIFQSCMLHEMKPFGIYRAQETFLVHRILLLTFALVPSQTSLPWYIGANYVYIFPDCVYIHTKWAHTTLNVSMLTCCKLLSRTYVRTPKSNTPTWNPWCVCTWMVCVS